MSDQPDITGEFDRAHSARLASPTLDRIWRQAYGEDYPEAVTPSAFYALSTLRRLREGLHLAAGTTIADLGCGNGGAGLWLARELGVGVIGIDLSGSGVANASRRAAQLGLVSQVQFRTGDLTATGLPPASCDGAICLDVLPFVPDKTAAFREVARILRPGARFAFTTWEQDGFSSRLNAQQLPDYRPPLVEAGFAIELYEEPLYWRQQQRAALEGLLSAKAELAAELEPSLVDQYVRLANGMLVDMAARRYVSAIARRG
jgi:SAM-dependent methyltransferase